jgi:hypothetical protein
MKKLFVIALAIAMMAAFTMPAMATQSRVAAMGGYGRYLEDDFNIFEWPATLPSYSNIVWVELMTEQWWEGDNCPEDLDCDEIIPAIGASFALGEDGAYGTLAMFFYDVSEPLNPFWSYNWSVEWNTDNAFMWSNAHKLHLLYGYAMEGLSFGLALTRSDDSYKFEDGTTEEYHDSYTTISAGVRFDVGEAAYMDVNFELGMGSSMYNTPWSGYGEITEDGSTIYGLKARMFWEWTETVTLVPYFGWSSFDFSFKADSADYNDVYWGDKGTMLELGIGANIAVNEDNLLLFAIEPYSYAKREPSAIPSGVDGDWTSTYTVMPRFILGLESDIKDWLTFRLGGTHELVKREDKSCNGEVDGTCTGTWSDFSYYMGLGFHLGDWDIDCVMNNATPFRLGYWLTGMGQDESEDEVAMWMFSAKYHF